MTRWTIWLGMILSAVGQVAGSPISPGYSCSGNCGMLAANGDVSLSPFGSSQYYYVTTDQGLDGVGVSPTGRVGPGWETNGSVLTTPAFTANAGDALDLYFNYVSADGELFEDYSWAALTDGATTTFLFTAFSADVGSMVPATRLPAIDPGVTLTPSAPGFRQTAGRALWAPLGVSSSTLCVELGCGSTGWVHAMYNIPVGGTYSLQFGVVNWIDKAEQSGLAIDGLTVGGVPIGATVPEPSTMAMFGIGLVGLGLGLRRRMP